MRRFLLALGVPLLALGCGGSFEEARVPRLVGADPAPVIALSVRCQQLSDQQRRLAASSILWGTIGGASGITAIPNTTNAVRIGFGVTAVVATGLSLASGAFAQSDGVEWAKECSGS